MNVGKLPVVNPFNLCIVVVGGSATNLGILRWYPSLNQLFQWDTQWYFTCQKDLSLEKLSMSEAGDGIGFGQGLQYWQLVLAGKQFNSGHPESTCVDLEFLGLKDAIPDMVLDWEGCRCGDRSHISMHLKEEGSQVCRCQHHVLFYLIRQALWHLWEEWQPFEKLPAVGSGFEHLPVLSGLEEPDRHKVAACTCNWREPVFSRGSRWWRCRSRWSRRLPPRRGRAGTWRYFRTFSSSTSLPEDSSISQSEIDIGV